MTQQGYMKHINRNNEDKPWDGIFSIGQIYVLCLVLNDILKNSQQSGGESEVRCMDLAINCLCLALRFKQHTVHRLFVIQSVLLGFFASQCFLITKYNNRETVPV